MMKSSTQFFNVLEEKHCSICNQPLTEMADCYSTVCEKCAGSVFYPLSPAVAAEVKQLPHSFK